jgi:hypothetical protein
MRCACEYQTQEKWTAIDGNFGLGGVYGTDTGRGISGENYVKQIAAKIRCVCVGEGQQIEMKWERSLDHTTLKSTALWTVWVLISAHWTPYRRYLGKHVNIFGRSVTANERDGLWLICNTESNYQQPLKLAVEGARQNKIVKPTSHWLH